MLIYQIELMPEGEIAMTREAILKEIQLLPDDMLEAIWNMVMQSELSQSHSHLKPPVSPSRIPKEDFWEEARKYVSVEHPELNHLGVQPHPVAGIAKGEFWMADDFDAPMDEMKEYMY